MKFTVIFASVIAAFTVGVVARDCTPGLDYCGSVLKDIGNENRLVVRQCLYDYGRQWDEQDDTLFTCSPNSSGEYVGYLTYKTYCGRGRCHNGGGGKHDYCS
ncbi:hypothetical protein MKEN_00263900 [Mycena kentingensis (nom. inval.)]|nr:hypothetical protein MKEN_00263900 [Mycena kentingensis (nom. inval.)]